MAGPERQFDKMEALAQCMHAFQSSGYRQTSYAQLVKATGVNRSSIYAAFGDKAALFEQALQMYVDRGIAMMTETLRGQASPFQGIIAALKMIEKRATESGPQGCLCGNSASGVAEQNPNVARIIQTFYNRFRDLFQQSFEHAIAAGELSADIDSAHWSMLILTLTQGLSNLVQGGIERQSVRSLMSGLIGQLHALNHEHKKQR